MTSLCIIHAHADAREISTEEHAWRGSSLWTLTLRQTTAISLPKALACHDEEPDRDTPPRYYRKTSFNIGRFGSREKPSEKKFCGKHLTLWRVHELFLVMSRYRSFLSSLEIVCVVTLIRVVNNCQFFFSFFFFENEKSRHLLQCCYYNIKIKGF